MFYRYLLRVASIFTMMGLMFVLTGWQFIAAE